MTLKADSAVLLFAFLAMILIPVAFSYAVVFPFLSPGYQMVLLLMHVVFASGFLLLSRFWDTIKKIF